MVLEVEQCILSLQKLSIYYFVLCAQNAFMDLVDVFAMPSEPPSDRPWNASHPGDTDPWDSLGEPFVDQAAFI